MLPIKARSNNLPRLAAEIGERISDARAIVKKLEQHQQDAVGMVPTAPLG